MHANNTLRKVSEVAAPGTPSVYFLYTTNEMLARHISVQMRTNGWQVLTSGLKRPLTTEYALFVNAPLTEIEARETLAFLKPAAVKAHVVIVGKQTKVTLEARSFMSLRFGEYAFGGGDPAPEKIVDLLQVKLLQRLREGRY